MKEVVISVPHSGTRTLSQHLGIVREPLSSGEWHFGNPVARETIKNGDKVHVPIRNPIDVATSWASRGKTDGALDRLLEHYRWMFLFLRSGNAQLHIIEELPVLQGAGERIPGDHAELVAEYQAAVIANVVTPFNNFFNSFYPGMLDVATIH